MEPIQTTTPPLLLEGLPAELGHARQVRGMAYVHERKTVISANGNPTHFPLSKR